MTSAEELVVQAKLFAYRDVYLDLLNDHRIPYDVCKKIKEKIVALESVDLKNVAVK